MIDLLVFQKQIHWESIAHNYNVLLWLYHFISKKFISLDTLDIW